MDATQMINDSLLESNEEENEDDQTSKGNPLAKLHILKNEHMPETELPLFLGENVLGRDGSTCTVSLPSPSVSKRHATVSISLYRSRGDVGMEALVWDHGSLNGTRKGRLKLTPNVRYALSDHDSLVLADIPCQYVSCSADMAIPQHNFKTPVSVSSVVESRLIDASNKKEIDVYSEESDRAPEAKVSSPPLKDTKNTPVRTICLSFEPTPTPAQATLVPESDVDSDEERESRANWRQKTLDSNSDLNKSNPTCSSFLSPTNKIVPESEDESPITPSISTKNRPHRHVGFNKEETNINVGRQQLKEKTASEEEDKRVALEGKIPPGSGPHMLGYQECNVGLKDDKLPVSTPPVITDAFKMDSDTDLEGEEEGVASAIAVTLAANQGVDHTSDRAQFYMDSDTDVEENNESAPPPENKTRCVPAIPLFQAEEIHLGSDTDVDAEDALPKPTLMQSKTTAESAPTTHLKHFHLDSDTESEEEDMKPVQRNSSVKMPQTLAKLTESVSAAPPRPDSETDDEAAPALATSKSGDTESGPAAHAHADLDILSDSDTDAEPNSPLVKQTVVDTDMSFARGAVSKAIPSDSDADTDVDESSTAPGLERVTAVGLHAKGEEDVEDEVPVAATGKRQVPRPVRDNLPGLLNSSNQYCSTPVQLPESQVENMETQAFLSPISGRCVAIPALRTEALAFDSDNQEDENNVVWAETQSFVVQTETTRACHPGTTEDETGKQSCREESFRLGLSDSSHLQDPLQALAMERTQAFVSVEASQLYAAKSHANQTSSELEATQSYVSDQIIGSFHGPEDETDDEEKRAIATDETQPFYAATSATLAMAETQPMCASEEEEKDVKFTVSTAVRVKVRSMNETEAREEHSKTVGSQERPFAEVLPLAETQPMCTSNDRESNEEYSFPGRRKRKTKRLQIEEKQTQPLTSLELSLDETQPLQSADENLAAPGSEAFHGGSSAGAFRNSGALHKKLALTTSGRPAVETKPLRYLKEETLTLSVTESSVGETQPMKSEESDGGDSLPGTEIAKAKPSQILEEKTHLLTNSEFSICEAQVLEAEAGDSGSNVGDKRGTRARSRNVSNQRDETSRRRTGGRKKAASAAAARGKSKSSGEEREKEQEDEEEEHPTEAGGLKSSRLRNDVNKNELAISPMTTEGEPSLGKKKGGTDVRQRLREDSEEERMEADESEKMEQEGVHLEVDEERTEAEKAQRLRIECERAEREKLERERKEQEGRAEGRLKDTEQKEREDKASLEHERAEREDKVRLEREENTRMSSDRKDKEKEVQECKRREHGQNLEREVWQHSARREIEAKELDSVESAEKGKVTGGETLQDHQEQKEEEEAKVSARGQRAARKKAATEPANNSAAWINDDDVPARRTRSRSNSSNSVSSERSASSVHTQESTGRGRGRGARRTGDPPHAVASRSSSRRKTAAAHPTQEDAYEASGDFFRSGCSNSSLNQSSRGRGRVSRQRARGGAAEANSGSPAISQRNLETPTRGRKSSKAESSHETEKADPRQASTSRGRWRSDDHGSETAGAGGCSSQGSHWANEEPEKNVREGSHEEAKGEAEVLPGSPAAGSLDETMTLGKGRKRQSQANADDDPASNSKLFKCGGGEPGVAKEEAKHQAQKELPAQAKRRGRASTAQTKNTPKTSDTGPGVAERNDRMAGEAVERGRGRPSVAQRKAKEEQLSTETSADQHAPAVEPQVQSPAGRVPRKRQAPVDSSPLTKTPRSSSLSPAPGVLSHTYKVLFTGVVDEAGERLVAHLGGSLAKGVADMNCLVTDRVRRTVKFLCAVAKGIPVVTTQWLEKSGKAGSFLPPSSFVVKDQEQEKKFTFCLQESLLVASRQPLLQGYQIHVTKSVKPEPVQMKDILTCSGATFLPKMPSSHKALTVVISCEEDWHLCAPALLASVPIVTAEFVLSGILQQKLDFQAHTLSPPASSLQPAAGRVRGRKKT